MGAQAGCGIGFAPVSGRSWILKDIKRGIREVTTRGKAAMREVNGHTLSDDIGNAGDNIRKDAANARDEAQDQERRARAREAQRDVERQPNKPADDPITRP